MNRRLKIVTAVACPLLMPLALHLLAQNPSPAMQFVKITPGEFQMGCSANDAECNADENPRHRVRITKPFEIGKYEVTQAEWTAVMQMNPSANKGANLPVESVSKFEAQDFLAKLNAKSDGYRYRLPTEAEWEYAARAGANFPYSGSLDRIAWYAANSEDETHPVGRKEPNAWGLYDMHGNVREWVSDLYSATYYGTSPADDPTGPPPCPNGVNPPGTFVPNAGRGGRGFGPGQPPQGPPPGPPLNGGPQNQQQQIDDLRRQVEQLRQELQQLRDEVRGGPGPARGFRGGPGGPPLPGGPPGAIVSGPSVCVGQSDGTVQLVDPLDGLPTGLPVMRGGGWDQSAAYLRASARYTYYGPTLRLSDIGFRVVREPVSR